MDDSALVKKCIEGDPKAQRLLFDKFAPKMLGVCMRYAKNTEQAEDVLQEGFIKVFTNKRWNVHNSFYLNFERRKEWIFRIPHVER